MPTWSKSFGSLISETLGPEETEEEEETSKMLRLFGFQEMRGI